MDELLTISRCFEPHAVGTAALVAARLLGILVAMPGEFFERGFSWRWKLCLTVALTAILAPVVPASPVVETEVQMCALFARETLLGALLGSGIHVLLFGVRVAGQLVSQLAGLSMAEPPRR